MAGIPNLYDTYPSTLIQSGISPLSTTGVSNGISITDYPNQPTKSYTLQGKMITAEVVLPETEVAELKTKYGNEAFKIEIKKRLYDIMVQKLINADMIDFGMQQNFTDFNYSFRGRIYVTPKDQTQVVKILLDNET